MIVRTRRTIFALNRCSSVSKFEHGQAQAMGIGIAFSNPTGPLGRDGTRTMWRSDLARSVQSRAGKGPETQQSKVTIRHWTVPAARANH